MKTAKYHFMLAWLVCCWAGIAGQILSRNRSVYMSSQWSDWSGNRVVDGNNRTDAERCRCCAATTTQTDPWITIDLGNTYMITRICVYGRTDITSQNLDNLVFKLDDTSFTPTTNSTPTLSYTFILDRPTAAQNVTLMLPGSNRLLALCEFDVFNDNVISTNKFINASSEINTDWPIEGAVDGNNTTDGNACHCCAATRQENNPWLRVDLGGYFFITYIIIYGRTDDNNTDQLFHGLKIEAGNGSIIRVPNTKNYYDSGAMRVGPATYVKLQLNGNRKYLVVCELQVFGECADGYTETDSSCQTVCPAGTYGTNCSKKCGSCRNEAICNHTDGVCQQCNDGFNEADKTCNTPCPDQKYGHNCDMNCGHCLGAESCNKTNGVCDECADGYMETDMLCTDLCPWGTYGTNCSETCGYCRNGLNCSQTNGTCESCKDGYTDTDALCQTPCLNGTFGKNCSETCGHCLNETTCNRTSGACVGCVDGFNETDITCRTRCLGGFYGYNCTEICGECRDGLACNTTNGVCERCEDGFDETDITCKTRCLGGTYGYNCTETCGECRYGLACNTTNGVCERCEDGFDETDITCKTPCENGTYGNNCTGVCGHCQNGAICNKTNGVCDQCEDGYMETDMLLCVELCPNGTYGNNCSERCGQCINGESCNKTNGNCGQCESGYTETDAKCKTPCVNGTYGHNCTDACGHCKNRAICNKANGVCDQCEDGYMETDMLCVESCVNGTYGHNCTSMCGHCKNGSICNKTNGVCDQCEDGYMETDMMCEEECTNGTYGQNCSKECGHCSGGEVCRQSDGFCSACEDGYIYTEEDAICKTEALQDEEGSNYVGAIYGTVVGVIVLACLAIGAIIFKRRSYGKEKTKQKYRNEPNDLKNEVCDRGQQNPGFEAVYPDEEEEEEERGTYYNLVPKTQDIPVSKLWSFVYQTKKNGSEILIKQYKDIGEHISPTKEAMAYRYKVRYKDMLPYDHTRVHLDVNEQGECEFINASHIHGFDRQNKFIASQGPMDVMVDDFWRMVWQQDSRKIVMLTNVIENGSVKCIQYWPELGEVITQGRIQITLVKEETTTDYVIRTLKLKQDQSRPRVIQQFHYKAWPDKDVPDSAWSLVMFWREVFKENDSSAGPIIVHCSAGVGRTGTFIALDNLYHQALQTGTINPFEIVSNLRTQRLKMVQTQMQYVYLHDAVAESLSIGTHYIWQTQFESYYNYMVKLDKGASQSRLQNQYQLMLDGMKHMKMAVKGGASEEHIYSNSEINEYRPKAQTSSRYEDVLGGNTLSNYAGKKSFIIMASPNKQEIHRFWNLVESRNIKTVVTLTYDGDPSSKPWSSRSSAKQGGSNTNSPIMVNEDREQGLCIRTYEFTKENKSSNKGNGVVKHFELTTAKSGFPNRDTMVKVLHDVFLWHQYLSESEQILIQCRDGEGQSGMMCVLLNEAARMKDEGHIHVLESVTLMKHQVPKIIPNFEQYKYLHDVILDMVKPKDLPADVNEAEDASIYENVATDKL